MDSFSIEHEPNMILETLSQLKSESIRGPCGNANLTHFLCISVYKSSEITSIINIANKTNQVPLFNCCNLQLLRKFQIITPLSCYTLYCFSPAVCSPPTIRNLKDDSSQVGEFYFAPIFLGGHYAKSQHFLTCHNLIH